MKLVREGEGSLQEKDLYGICDKCKCVFEYKVSETRDGNIYCPWCGEKLDKEHLYLSRHGITAKELSDIVYEVSDLCCTDYMCCRKYIVRHDIWGDVESMADDIRATM